MGAAKAITPLTRSSLSATMPFSPRTYNGVPESGLILTSIGSQLWQFIYTKNIVEFRVGKLRKKRFSRGSYEERQPDTYVVRHSYVLRGSLYFVDNKGAHTPAYGKKRGEP